MKKIKPRQYHSSHSLKYGSTYVRCFLCGASGEQLYGPCSASLSAKEKENIKEQVRKRMPKSPQ